MQGDLTDALFAADFGYVIEGIAPAVYQDSQVFLRNTHPTAALRKIVTTIFGRLADPNESGAALRLSTGFGGGKSHTLITLWHLAQNVDQTTMGTELHPCIPSILTRRSLQLCRQSEIWQRSLPHFANGGQIVI